MEPKRIEQIAGKAVQEFLFANENADETRWLLSGLEVADVPAAALAMQVAGRRKAKEKLPTFYALPGIVYPPSGNLEQTSSEVTASHKVQILRSELGDHLDTGADLTGGWGVDACFLSTLCTDFYFSDPEPRLVELAQHNHRLLGRTNLRYQTCALPESLAGLPDQVSFIYLDPSRRTKAGKVIALTDYTPNILGLLPQLFAKTHHLLLKTSPLLDISHTLRQLPNVKKVFVVAWKNECKELLFYCDKAYAGPVEIEAVDLARAKPFTFFTEDEARAAVVHSEPKRYLYEPGAAILKAGAFRLMAERFQVSKLHAHTHLYTSDRLAEDFPGRIFEVTSLRPDALPERKANIITRNFPEDPDVLKKAFRLTDGGDFFLLAFTGPRSRHVLVCRRVQ